MSIIRNQKNEKWFFKSLLWKGFQENNDINNNNNSNSNNIQKERKKQ